MDKGPAIFPKIRAGGIKIPVNGTQKYKPPPIEIGGG
jgi:hypothetical protein